MPDPVFGGPFWGKAAQMGVKMLDGRILDQSSLELPQGKEKIPLMRLPHPNEGQDPRDIIGVVEHVWYGDESGMQVIYFDGHWLKRHENFLHDYPEDRWPAISADQITWAEGENGFHVLTGRLRSMHLAKQETWLGSTSTFIWSKPLPQALANRGRII